MIAKKSTRPKPKKWLPRDHPKYIEEIEKVDVPLRRVLGANLYVRAKARGEREAVLKLWEHFLERADPDLQWWYDSNVERLRPFEDRYRDFPARALAATPKKLAYWNVHSGDRARDAGALHFSAMLGASAKVDEQLDSFSWTGRGESPLESLLGEALEFAQTTEVRHGTLGLSLSLPATSKRPLYHGHMYAACARFQGLDFPETFERASCLDGIPTSNWVTFVHQTFLKKLGGATKLRKTLSREIVFHEVLEGIAIQAGPRPLLGDVNAGEDLPLYYEVGRALAPIRSGTAYRGRWRLHFGGPNEQRNNFNTEETAAWLSRFER